MAANTYDALLLQNQLCFPLYACSREVIKQYRPYLDTLGLTYTQYITLMVIWAEGTVSVRDLGKQLYLDSGTLTPVLKHLEAEGYITRRRCPADERVLLVTITEEGIAKVVESRAVFESSDHAMFEGFTEEEMETLLSFMERIEHNLDAVGAPVNPPPKHS